MKLNKTTELEPILQKKVQEGRKIVIAVHPPHKKTKPKLYYEDYGSYPKYFSNVWQYLKEDDLFVIYLIGENQFDTFEGATNPKEPYVLIKTDFDSPELYNKESHKFHSILERVNAPIYLVGEFLWRMVPIAFANILKLSKILKKHGYAEASKEVYKYLHPPPGKREEIHIPQFLKFLNKIGVTDEVVKTCFNGKLFVIRKNTCIPILRKGLKNKVKMKIIRECCFPLKDPPK